MDPLVLIGTVLAALLASGGGLYLARAQRSKLHVETADIAVNIVNKAMEAQRVQNTILARQNAELGEQVSRLASEVQRLNQVVATLELQIKQHDA